MCTIMHTTLGERVPVSMSHESFRLTILLLGASCAAADDVQFLRAAPETAEGISLLGDTLRRPPLAAEDGQRLVEDLQVARGEYAAHPSALAYRLAVARRTASLGRIREALGLYTQAAHR